MHWCERRRWIEACDVTQNIPQVFTSKPVWKKTLHCFTCEEEQYCPLVPGERITLGTLQMISSHPLQQDNKWLLSFFFCLPFTCLSLCHLDRMDDKDFLGWPGCVYTIKLSWTTWLIPWPRQEQSRRNVISAVYQPRLGKND